MSTRIGITNIDTLKIMINVEEYEQHDFFYAVRGLISDLSFVFVKKRKQKIGRSKTNIYHDIFYKGKKIADLTLGRYRACTYGIDNTVDAFYIAVRFCGMTKYHDSDIGSLECLLTLCTYLNNKQRMFRIKEIDICYDIQCPLDNILTLLNKTVPNVKYFPPDEAQGNGKIKRIENVPEQLYNKVMSRAYTYCKFSRNSWIEHNLTRFEIKFNPSFFRTNRKYLRSINNSIGKYTILYFKDLNTRGKVLDSHREQWRNNKLDINELGIEKYKLTIDMDYVEEYIDMLLTIDDYFTYDMVKPTRDKKL